jgi:plasmid replication initiation protein
MQLRYTEFSTALYIMKRTVSENSLNTTFNLLLNKNIEDLSPKVKEAFDKACSKIKNETDRQKIFRDIAFLSSVREYKEGLSNCNLTTSMIKEIDNVLIEENL